MSAPATRQSVGLIKRAWNETSDIVGGSVLAIIGLGMAAVGLTVNYKNDGGNRHYKYDFVVMPDNPRAAKVHKD